MALFFAGKHTIFRRFITTSNKFQQGYIVLVPEIGEDSPDKNALLRNDGLPEFNSITIENCKVAIAKQALDFEACVKKLDKELTQDDKTCKNVFEEVFNPLEEVSLDLETTWGLSKALYVGNSSLMPTSSYMAIHDRARIARSAKYNSKGIYEAAKFASQKAEKRSVEENRILQKFLTEGRLNGLDLNENEKRIMEEHLKNLNKERIMFKQKTDIATKQFKHRITDNIVTREFPVNLLKLTAVDPQNYLNGPWTLTLQPQICNSGMEYCSDSKIRHNLWQGLVGRGANYRDRELTTSLNLETIRYLRRNIAKSLGYETYADMSMETKMAGSVSQVNNILAILLERARPAQENELNQLFEFAKERGYAGGKLQIWDVPYWRRKQLTTELGYDEQKFKEYFPLNNVVNGLFQLVEKLFDITIKQRTNVSGWHKDVKFFDIFESHSSAPVAGFYLDLYARSEQKVKFETTGWMVGIQSQSRVTNRKPLAALIFNFDPPIGDRPLCLTFKEVKSLFLRFGRALQHLLTRTSYSEVAGLSNIEWDAVEVSGNVLTHWLYNKSVIDSISCHCDSEDKLPQQMFQSLVSMHKHMAGLDLCQELYLSTLDLELHSTKEFWLDMIKRLYPEYHCFELDKFDWHPCSFVQIFSDEWGAAYYSHIWSRMVAADVYSAFHEVQGDEQQIVDVGKRYRDTFLALGGSEHAGQIFREFRGRDPSPKALLSSLGLKKIKELPA